MPFDWRTVFSCLLLISHCYGKGTKLELPILFGAFYGLRRSEAIGLKWDAIDFDQNTITIRHTVTSCDLDGKRILVAADTIRTPTS